MSLKPKDEFDQSQLPPPSLKSSDPWATDPQTPGAFPVSPEAQEGVVSAPHSLSAAVKARRDEYIRKMSMRIKIGTWNVASINGTEKDLGAWFVEGYGGRSLSQELAGTSVEDDQDSDSDENGESVESQEARMSRKKTTVPMDDVPAETHGHRIDLYVLGLQEIVDVTSMTEAVKPYTDPNPGQKWKKALKHALPVGFSKIAEQQLLGLLILVYASPELAPSISSVSATSVGTGLMGYLGNKGAVAVRIVVGEATKLCFVNCHLAAGADQTALNRRTWDTNQILNRTRFPLASLDGEAAEDGEEKIGDEDFGFWFGDLNYRLDDIPGEDVRRLLLLHTRNEYDSENISQRRIDSELGFISAPSNEHFEHRDQERPASESTSGPELDPKSDPASLHTTLQSLLAHDQLRTQQRLQKAFHEGWREGEINFLPTYKYDVGSVGMFDSGEKQRSPSWCDRILYRTRRDKEMHEEKAKQLAEARKKDESMKARGIDEATVEHDVLFDYDPETDGLAYGDDYDEYEEREENFHDAELVQTREDDGDLIELHSYNSHQRVLSSDHKPLGAIFTLTYDAVIPELKAKIHQEVARELDKAENEGRPAVTVVVDDHSDELGPNADGAADMNAVHFGDVRYGVKKTRMVTIANTGQIAASFSFVERPTESEEGARVVPEWLELHLESHVMQQSGQAHKPGDQISLSPGETTSIELSIDVTDGRLVYELNKGITQLEDILVLRIENGRDHFIPVKGNWLQSSFFRTLDELVVAPEGGVRKLPKSHKNRDSTGTGNVHSSATHHSAPKELYSLTEILPIFIERSIAEWGMIHDEDIPPWQYENGGLSWPFNRDTWTFHEGEERLELLAGVREALDTAAPLDRNLDPDVPGIVRLEILAETLISFLQSLRDGIISAEIWSDVEVRLSTMEKGKAHPSPEEIQDMVMDVLSQFPVHSVSFTFITFLMNRIVNELVPCGKPAPTSGTPAPASPNPSRRSRASTLSVDSGDTPLMSGQETPGKRGLFLTLRRHRTQSISSSSDPTTEAVMAASERRKQLIRAYVEIFAPIITRSENDTNYKGKDKKALEGRKRRVLEVFLNARHV
ncbi:uncharacterized protein Z518_01281 [Rhinocladiella mackenziei CBS 650.93]|uniref:Inositol polyphosphate-related phosphatase domain-containing protein n=1 Tax=Rhinocladiella mackenziei CBS 650.93 TaxID=1442369 RepID=A0A0D2JL59_9EURO|nr:uncharacterized protein Z518_01281 [Rhinocladiella mackenziei CBS 650.93]KIX10200.1 hypothetical protein Z518_01281 [Rhinocladiella mackenziei CBS 650.93]